MFTEILAALRSQLQGVALRRKRRQSGRAVARIGKMAGRLTTHVLDTARGTPAAGVRIRLFRRSANLARQIAEAVTNADGRTDAPLLAGESFVAGQYELVFEAGEYLRAQGTSGVLFLDDIPIRFGVADREAHYHVPLLLSPFGYSTYRGS